MISIKTGHFECEEFGEVLAFRVTRAALPPGDAEGKFVDRLPKLVANKALKHAWDFAGFTVEPPKVRAADAPEPVV